MATKDATFSVIGSANTANGKLKTRRGTRTGSSIPIVEFYPWDDNIIGDFIGPDGRTKAKVKQEKVNPNLTVKQLNETKSVIRIFNVPNTKDIATIFHNAVETISVQKTLNDPAGSFTIQLSPYPGSPKDGMSWDRIISEGSWVKIKLHKSGVDDLISVMHGKIDSVSVNLSADDVQTSAQVTITGRDMAAAALDMPIYFNPYDEPLKANLGGMAMKKIFAYEGTTNAIAGYPGDVVKLMLKAATDEGISYGFPPKVPAGFDVGTNAFPSAEFLTQQVGVTLEATKWADAIDWDTSVSKTIKGKIFNPGVLQPGNQNSVWQWAACYQNPAMNEMFIDTNDEGKTSFVFRERPFVNAKDGDNSPWFKLSPNPVPLSLVTTMSATRGQNRVNHVYIQGKYGTQNASVMAISHPQVNAQSIERYGLKRVEFQTPYLAEQESKWVEESQAWIALLKDWNTLNAYHYNGTLTLADAIPSYRVGQKIALVEGPSPMVWVVPESKGKDDKDCFTAYVEGVSHNFVCSDMPQAETTIQFTRGYIDSLRVEHMKAELKNWKGMGVKDEAPADAGAEEPQTPTDTNTPAEVPAK